MKELTFDKPPERSGMTRRSRRQSVSRVGDDYLLLSAGTRSPALVSIGAVSLVRSACRGDRHPSQAATRKLEKDNSITKTDEIMRILFSESAAIGRLPPIDRHR